MAAVARSAAKIQLRLGSSGSSHVSCASPTVRALTKNLVLRGPRGRIARNSVKNQFNCPSGRRFKVASASGLTDQETQGAGWCIRGSTFPVCFFFSFFFFSPFLFFCPTAALVSWRRSMVSDPKGDGWAMFAGNEFSFRHRRTGRDTEVAGSCSAATIFLCSTASLSVQIMLDLRQKSYESGQPKLMTDMIGVH